MQLKNTSQSTIKFQTCGVSPWYTWFDRDLTVAGRITVKKEENFYYKLIHLNDQPIARIPSFWNDHTNFSEINVGTQLALFLSNSLNKVDLFSADQHPKLLQTIASHINVAVNDICELELNICDFQKSNLIGNEFISAPRISNAACSFIALQAFLQSCHEGQLNNESNISMISLFDNGVGNSCQDRATYSTFFDNVCRRIMVSLNKGKDIGDSLEQSFANSFCISINTTNATNPNVPTGADAKSTLSSGPVLLSPCCEYQTSLWNTFTICELAKANCTSYQVFSLS